VWRSDPALDAGFFISVVAFRSAGFQPAFPEGWWRRKVAATAGKMPAVQDNGAVLPGAGLALFEN
jgi:hypothetical protein